MLPTPDVLATCGRTLADAWRHVAASRDVPSQENTRAPENKEPRASAKRGEWGRRHQSPLTPVPPSVPVPVPVTSFGWTAFPAKPWKPQSEKTSRRACAWTHRFLINEPTWPASWPTGQHFGQIYSNTCLAPSFLNIIFHKIKSLIFKCVNNTMSNVCVIFYTHPICI